MENKTYYGEYDFKILVETSQNASVVPTYNRNNFKYKISSKSGLSPFINKSTRNFMKDSLHINESDIPNICLYKDKHLITPYIKKIFSKGNFYYKITFTISNDIGNIFEPAVFFMFYIGNERFYPMITATQNSLNGEILINYISPIYNKLSTNTNMDNIKILAYRVDTTIPLFASFLVYNSDSFTNKNDFLSMESFEGKLTIAEENQYTNDKYYDIIYQNYKKKEKKYKITLIEQEYEKSILSRFNKTDNGRYIKLTKLYDDRIEEYFNCELENFPTINEAEDVNTRTIELSCDFAYVRYFDNNGIISIEGDVI